VVGNQPPTALPLQVLERADMRDAIQRRDFGAVFALARKWAGISYSRIADACGIKPERVGTLARGDGSITSYDKIAQIADALRIPGEMLGLAQRDWEQWPLHESKGDDAVIRRDFLRTTMLGVGLTLTVPVVGNGAGRLRTAVPEQLRARTARLRRLDDILGGGDTFHIYLQEYELTRRLLRERSYNDTIGRELLSVLSEQAQQAGWAAFDAGNHSEARRLYEASYTAANQADDAPLAGNALAFLAYQRIGDDKDAAVATAVESCRTAGPDAPAGVRALLHERLAWAHAVAGNAAETERSLAVAQEALSQLSEQRQPDWTAWVDHNELQIMTGRCWTELRRPLRAVPVLEQVLAGFDDKHARDKALYLCWLADAYLCAGEIEQAADVAHRVIDLSAGVASVRPRQRLAPVLRGLAVHRTVPAVREALEAART
jgi:tetratricopeptide (TPR) repeat protein